jgi:hypothetical protein
MLARLPIIASLATLVAADFKIYWYSQSVSDPSSGAAAYGGIKFFNSPPDCNGFINEGKGFDIDFDGDVSDGQNGGYACDGCDENVNWNDWRPSRIEINDLRKQVFANEPYHISESNNYILAFRLSSFSSCSFLRRHGRGVISFSLLIHWQRCMGMVMALIPSGIRRITRTVPAVS